MFMLHTRKPKNFKPKFKVVSCFLEYNDEILLLLRQEHKNEPNTYWVPAWKVNKNEKINDAILREIFEETWLELDNLQYFREVFVQYPSYEFIYHIYYKKLEEQPNIKINPEEHKNYIWRNPKKALEENLIQELDNCIKMFYND